MAHETCQQISAMLPDNLGKPPVSAIGGGNIFLISCVVKTEGHSHPLIAQYDP